MSDRYTLHAGDCRDVMRDYPSDHFDSIVSDPPYGLSFMGNGWDKGVPGEEFWREALRVAKPGTHLLAFGGTRTFHRLTVAIENAGWEIRDVVCWLYGSGFPKSLNVGGGWGTALKPAWEPIVMARKPLMGTVAANLLMHGTGALNVDGCRIPIEGAAGVWGAKHVASIGFHGGTAGSGFATVQHSQGRWPANVMHDGSDEVVAEFPTTGAASNRPRHNTASMGYGGSEVPFETRGHSDGGGSASRFFYCAKASNADREEGNTHPTVKPTDLMRYLCRLVTPADGLVLDPFMGSGSTGKGALLEGFRFVGIDLDPAHVAIAEARCQFAVETVESESAQLTLF